MCPQKKFFEVLICVILQREADGWWDVKGSWGSREFGKDAKSACLFLYLALSFCL